MQPSPASATHSRRHIPKQPIQLCMQPSLHQPHTPEGTYPCSLYSYACSQACISHTLQKVHTHAAYIAMNAAKPASATHSRRYIPMQPIQLCMQPSLHQPHTPEGTYPCSLYSYACSHTCISHTLQKVHTHAAYIAMHATKPASATHSRMYIPYIAQHQTTPPCSQALRQPRYIPVQPIQLCIRPRPHAAKPCVSHKPEGTYLAMHQTTPSGGHAPPAAKATPSRHSEPCIRPHPPEGAHTHHSE